MNINGVGGLGDAYAAANTTATNTAAAAAAAVGSVVGGYDGGGGGCAKAVPLTDSIFSGTDSVYGDVADESKERERGLDGAMPVASSYSYSFSSIYANADLVSATRLSRTGDVTINHRESDPRLLAFALSRRTRVFSLENCSFVIPPPPDAYGNSSSSSSSSAAAAAAVTNARIAVQRELNLPLNLTFEVPLYKKLGLGMPRLHCDTSDYFR